MSGHYAEILPRAAQLAVVATGEVTERLNVAVSKTVGRASAPWVRIPPSPPYHGSEEAPKETA